MKVVHAEHTPDTTSGAVFAIWLQLNLWNSICLIREVGERCLEQKKTKFAVVLLLNIVLILIPQKLVGSSPFGFH